MAKSRIPSRLTSALLETAEGLKRAGVLAPSMHRKITLRHLGDEPGLPAITGKEIRRLREHACLSQAVFARRLNVTPGYVSQLERGAKQPTGPALVLLDVIRRKGMQAIA